MRMDSYQNSERHPDAHTVTPALSRGPVIRRKLGLRPSCAGPPDRRSLRALLRGDSYFVVALIGAAFDVTRPVASADARATCWLFGVHGSFGVAAFSDALSWSSRSDLARPLASSF